MKKPIYLDYNATTPLDPRVLDEMLPYLKEEYGNPSSNSHSYGWEAAKAVKKSREQVAKSIGANPDEMYFTSGATESNNMAILGLALQFLKSRMHIITSNVEHKAVLDVCKQAEEWGADVTYLPVNEMGQISPDQVQEAIKPNTRLISIMMANNEMGAVNPIKEIGKIAKAHGVFFHTDAAQTFSKMPIDVNEMGIDLLSISGHKIYGPKGVGALYVRNANPKVILKPLMFGGAQEKELRPGTLNVASIVGLGKASELGVELMEEMSTRLCSLRKKIIDEVLQKVPEAVLNGHPEMRLCNNISFSFKGLSADMFALGLSGLAVSSSSACSSGKGEGSYVIRALGRCEQQAKSTLRIGLGRTTTEEDVRTAINKIVAMVEKNRKLEQAL